MLQALGLLGQSVLSSGLLSSGVIIDLGDDPAALRYRDSSQEPWTITVGWTDLDPIIETRGASVPASITVGTTLGESANQPLTCAQVELEAPPGRRVIAASGPTGTDALSFRANALQLPAGLLPEVNETLHFRQRMGWVFDPAMDALDPTTMTQSAEAIRQGDLDAIARYTYFKAAAYLRSIPEALQAYRYVGPDRSVTQSNFELSAQPSSDPRSASDVVNTLAYDSELLNRVSDRCRRIFDYGISVSLAVGKRVALMATSKNDVRVNVVNTGSGLIQLIWIALQLELAKSKVNRFGVTLTPTVGVEEPEVHLHPAVQPAVARMLANYATTGTQVLCTTQSEHFLMAVLQLVLEDKLDRGLLSVYYLDDGHAQKLEVDDRGRLSQGLRGFFEANEDQLARHLELLMRRA